jgi:hypothetical protein
MAISTWDDGALVGAWRQLRATLEIEYAADYFPWYAEEVKRGAAREGKVRANVDLTRSVETVLPACSTPTHLGCIWQTQ